MLSLKLSVRMKTLQKKLVSWYVANLIDSKEWIAIQTWKGEFRKVVWREWTIKSFDMKRYAVRSPIDGRCRSRRAEVTLVGKGKWGAGVATEVYHEVCCNYIAILGYSEWSTFAFNNYKPREWFNDWKILVIGF